MLTPIFSIAVVLVALAVTAYLLTLLLSAAAEPLENFWASRRFAAHQQKAKQSDVLLKLGAADAALRQLRAAFFLEPVRQPALLSEVVNHHAALLARMISLTNELCGGSVRLLSLAKADRLLSERNELQRRYLRAYENLQPVRLRDLTQELECNRMELEQALDQLFAEVQTLVTQRGRNRAHTRYF
jgi:hypothetical protein